MSLLFLPPAPHTGAFFDVMRESLKDLNTNAATYPGYGSLPAGPVSIKAYAASLLPQKGNTLVGFHTGCLVAVEMASQDPETGPLILIDIPYFDEETRAKHASGLEPDNPAHDAFRAAFAYDVDTALDNLLHEVTCIATESSLFEPTVLAASKIKTSRLIKRQDIHKPAFESPDMVTLIRKLAS